MLRPLRGQIGNPNRRPIREVINPNLSRLHAILCPEYNKDEIEDRQHRGWMREVVYTASNYSESNDYGPFKPDGSVDWSLMDAISSVMSEWAPLDQADVSVECERCIERRRSGLDPGFITAVVRRGADPQLGLPRLERARRRSVGLGRC